MLNVLGFCRNVLTLLLSLVQGSNQGGQLCSFVSYGEYKRYTFYKKKKKKKKKNTQRGNQKQKKPKKHKKKQPQKKKWEI